MRWSSLKDDPTKDPKVRTTLRPTVRHASVGPLLLSVCCCELLQVTGMLSSSKLALFVAMLPSKRSLGSGMVVTNREQINLQISV